jgi:VWFA-related protein
MRPIAVFLISALGLSFALAAFLFAQDDAAGKDDATTLKVEVNLVNILFNVRDKRGGLVGNLSKDDFKIFEDGKEQQVKYFNRETDLPLTIGLLIDVSASQMNLIDIEKNAAYQFFGSVLRKQDLAFLISFGEDAELLQDYTNSPKLLRAGLDGLQVNSGVGGIGPGPVPTASQPRGTILYDAVYLAAADQLKGQVGRKVLVLITDGEDEGSRYKIAQAIEAAQKADAIIYGFYYVDRAFYMGHGMIFAGGSDSTLRQMSEDTGGHVFHVDRKLTLQEAFSELQDEMRSQYAIGYTPTNPAKDGTFRKIEIKPANKDWKVQARKGYYAVKSDN